MNLELSKDEIYKIIKRKHFKVSKEWLITNLKKTYTRTMTFLEPLVKKKITGYERNDHIGSTNPLIWELGHVVYFWEYKTLRLIFEMELLEGIVIPDSDNKFNSHIVSKEERFEMKYNSKRIINSYHKTIMFIIEAIEHDTIVIDNINTYLIMISLLHNEMHNESFLFSSICLNLPKPRTLNVPIINNSNPLPVSFIKIPGFGFTQGIDSDVFNFTFDNEMPSFSVKVMDFQVSKYPITQYQYMKFVEAGGYKNKSYWLQQGWRWIKKNKIKHPLYWKKDDGSWKVKRFNKYLEMDYNLPVSNISWYEANAYCKWAGYRLPRESEWEFLATNGGTTLYPWGNRRINDEYCNINYQYDSPVEVDKYMAGDNHHGVSQLFGNVWEWCQEPIYPYDSFKIDPVYREMSYPFFGHKRVCRGGSWAVPDFLINSKYRNAQMPDCRIQFIGFRVCL